MADLKANFPDIRTPFINSATGQIDPVWWQFLLSLFTRTGLEPGSSGSDNAHAITLLQQAVLNLQLALAVVEGDVETLFRLVEESEIEIGNVDAKANSLADMIADLARQIEADPDSLRAAINSLSSSLTYAVRQTETDAGSLQAAINRNNDSLVSAIRQIEAEPGTIQAAINRVNDLLVSLGRNIEVDVTRPAFVMPRSFPVDYLDFDLTPSVALQTGRAAWNSADDTLDIRHSDNVTQQVGQELYGRILNNTGSTIPNGVALGINPATNSYVLFIANGTLSPLTIVGVTTQAIPNATSGRITVWGRVRDINTTGVPFGEIWLAGQILYVSTTIPGGFTNVKPTAPNLSMPIAQVVTVNATTGQIAVRPTIEQQLFYGQFAKTTDQSPLVVNTATALTWTSALIANGVSIGSPTSRIVVANAGLYKFSISLQLTSGSASVKNVWIWFRKNGVDVANSTLLTALDTSSVPRTPSRDLFFSLAAGDYVEIMFASDSLNMTVDAIPATAFAPAAPAALLSVNQEQQ